MGSRPLVARVPPGGRMGQPDPGRPGFLPVGRLGKPGPGRPGFFPAGRLVAPDPHGRADPSIPDGESGPGPSRILPDQPAWAAGSDPEPAPPAGFPDRPGGARLLQQTRRGDSGRYFPGRAGGLAREIAPVRDDSFWRVGYPDAPGRWRAVGGGWSFLIFWDLDRFCKIWQKLAKFDMAFQYQTSEI